MSDRLVQGPPHELAVDGLSDDDASEKANEQPDQNNERKWQTLPEQLQRVHETQLYGVRESLRPFGMDG